MDTAFHNIGFADVFELIIVEDDTEEGVDDEEVPTVAFSSILRDKDFQFLTLQDSCRYGIEDWRKERRRMGCGQVRI